MEREGRLGHAGWPRNRLVRGPQFKEVGPYGHGPGLATVHALQAPDPWGWSLRLMCATRKICRRSSTSGRAPDNSPEGDPGGCWFESSRWLMSDDRFELAWRRVEEMRHDSAMYGPEFFLRTLEEAVKAGLVAPTARGEGQLSRLQNPVML